MRNAESRLERVTWNVSLAPLATAALLSAVSLKAAVQPSAARFQPALDQAFTALYNSDFEGSRRILDQYLSGHPNDPVAYSIRASGLLFGELDRLGILESDFFKDDRRMASHKKLTADPQIRDKFYGALQKAEALANGQLSQDPKDVNALFALCLAKGDLTDYVALVEKRQMQSLSINKEGYRNAKRLLQVAPDFYDAYLTTGFTEYLIGSIPLLFRVFVRFDDVRGDTEAGVHNLKTVAERGHYLKPFAKILLATAYLREKRVADARALLSELTAEYPQNALLKRELDRLGSRM